MSSSSLLGCVDSLRTSMTLLDSSISILDQGVNDFPRLAKVLQTTRHFELVSEPTLQQAQSELESEIKPEIESLLIRVEHYLDRLERREQSLIAKSELQEGRLQGNPAAASSPSKRKTGGSAARGLGDAQAESLQTLKATQLRQKKDRLSYAVSRLEMQAQQKQRELRKSMAFQADEG